MEKNIELVICGTHKLDGQKETFTTKCDGSYFLKNEKHYFIYEEETEHGILKSNIKVYEDKMEVMKTGAINMHMFFELGEVLACNYNTPYGSIPIDIYTSRLDMYVEKNHIKVVVEYEMRDRDEIFAYCDLVIEGKN